MNAKRCLIAGVLGALFLSLMGNGFVVGAAAQGGNGQIGGIVQDGSKALVPGVTVTLKNVDTGVSTTQITNEAGSYNFSSVPPGTYAITGSLPGFKTSVTNGVQVGVAAQLRVNLTLEIGALDAKVEVSASAEQLLTESSASVGDVLTSARSLDLPLVGTDILDLVRILPGYRISPDSVVGGAVLDTFAGQSLASANVTRDGMSVTSGRYDPTQYGLTTGTNINPDLVGEIRLILAPVDAELGRGNAQIQILTKSGTNRYTGSAVWRVQNTALNANTWANNKTIVAGVWQPTQPDWKNAHNVTVTYGGPIIRNKTFFFASWEQQIANARTLQTATVFTDVGRQGIFRYWEKWSPQDAAPSNDPTSYPVTASTASRRSVDSSGTPLTPDRNPDGTPYVGGLRCFSVFGNVKFDNSPFTQADCVGGTAVINATPWDQFRLTPDTTGYIAKVLKAMPHANYWETGDGLNTAGFRWLRGAKGDAAGGTNAGSATARAGVADFVNRKQINLKIDENLGNKHRISGNWSYQRDDSGDFLALWPGGVNGETQRRPQLLTITATSTLSSSMLNEARFGARRDNTSSFAPIQSDNAAIREAAAEWYLTGGANPENGKTYPVSYTATLTGSNTGAIGSLFVGAQTYGSISPLYNYADTFSWTRGRHAFKFGGEVRLTRSNGFNSIGISVVPNANSGAGGVTSSLATTTNFATQLPNFLQSGRTGAAALLYFMNGSVSGAQMGRWINDSADVTNGHWEDMTTTGRKFRDQVQDEWDVFWKDDWKLTSDVTLNLGLRYEQYGSPYIGSGFTSAPFNLGAGLFGNAAGSSALFDRWLRPGNTFLTGYGNASSVNASNALTCTPGVTQSALLPVSTCDPNKLTKYEFVGPNTPNPTKFAIPRDNNNFGPAVGFAWQLPWLGKGKTTIRGGYQLTYGGPSRNGAGLDTFLGSSANLNSTTNTSDSDIAAIIATRALNLSDIPKLVPVRIASLPNQTLPIYGRAGTPESYDPTYATPYTQNLTMQLTRSLNQKMTVDMRYVGTLARKMDGTINVNQPAVFDNPEVFQALIDTRAGKDSPLFDRMFAGLNVSGVTTTGWGAVGTCIAQAAGSTAPGLGKEGCGANQVMQHGSAHLRRNSTYAANLANGNFVGVINSLTGVTAGSTAQGNTLQPLPTGVSGVNQRLLRNGCDRIANGLYDPAKATNPLVASSAANIPTTCFPEDYFIASPQFSGATFHGNFGHNNYHSLQTQFTLRPTQGTSLQFTHTWQKLLTNQYNGYVDVRDRNADYSLSRTSAAQEIRMNGTFELPLGPNRILFGGASGWIARTIERWQTSLILNYSTGAPRDAYTSGQFLYAAGDGGSGPQARPDVVGPWVNPKTNFQWNGPSNNSGTIFGSPSPFAAYDDPQCANLVAGTDGMGTNLRTSCTLSGLAVVVPSGTAGAQLLKDGVTYGIPVLRNPLPGKQGNLSARTLRAPGYYSLDGNLSKSFRFGETRSLQLRFDSNNILNHPNPGGPVYDIQSANFGRVTANKTGSRTFQGQLRVSF